MIHMMLKEKEKGVCLLFLFLFAHQHPKQMKKDIIAIDTTKIGSLPFLARKPLDFFVYSANVGNKKKKKNLRY